MISSSSPLPVLSALLYLIIGCSYCNARRLAILTSRSNINNRHHISSSSSSRLSSSSDNNNVVSTTLHGFPSYINTDKNDNISLQSHQQQLLLEEQLESSIFLYRGGSNSDHEDDNNNDEEEEIGEELVDSDRDSASAAEDVDHKVHTEENIQVTSTVANSPNSQDTASEGEVTVEAHTTSTSKQHKKSNAVGDPDGNSSDDESSDMEEDELLELNELEKELMLEELKKQREKGGQGGGFETLVELASKRADMKQRIAEMEMEMANRRIDKNNNNGEEDDGMEINVDVEIELDLVEEEGEDHELDIHGEEEDEGEETTSYHLAGTNVTKEDEVLKRQRKYKHGSIFKGSSSSTSNKRRKTTTPGGTTKNPEQHIKPQPPSIPTTIDSTTFDNMLITAFQSMIYLPPPSPRLPSPDGSVSLRNIDVSARRRLDRRTLYHGLLAELGGSHYHTQKDGGGDDKVATDTSSSKKDNTINSMIRRRYLDMETSRSLKGALSLACQPKWREKLLASDADNVDKTKKDDDEEETTMPTQWHRGGVCLFPEHDDEGMFEGGASSISGGRRGSGFQQQQPQSSFMGGPQQGMGGMNGEGGGGPSGFFGPMQEGGEDDTSSESSIPKPWRCTMGMQETVAMALAHSLSCGLALIDDDALSGVRESVESSLAELAIAMKKKSEEGDANVVREDEGSPPTINPEELRNSALLGHLVRLANEGKLGGGSEVSKPDDTENESFDDVDKDKTAKATGFGKISHRMERDMKLGLDDSNDDLAVESLRLMKEDEKQWFEPIDKNQDGNEEETIDEKPQSLVLFLRSDSSPSILKSKSAVETLAQECVKKDGIHLLMLGGKGIDATTTSLSATQGNGGGVGVANSRMNRQSSMMNQQQGGSPFSFMSNFAPGSPEFNTQMQNQQQQFNAQSQGGSFSANSANASGENDPDGSRRFNIFLARTVDPTGKPQIMGTIASPQAGNLFPTILANMAKENMRKLQEQGIDEDNEQQAMFMKQMEDLANHAQQHMDNTQGNNSGGDGGGASPPNAAFFNATITSPFGSEIFNRMNNQHNGEDGEQPQQFQPPPEAVQRAIQDAMSGVIERLAQMSATASSTNKGISSPEIPMNIARAFSQVLSNENLRRGIAENLAKAAPALVDPRCQGVMLSVYVPPGPEHPNRGMMPGDPRAPKRQQQQQQQQSPPSQQQPARAEKNDHIPHGMGGWLNKILSSSPDKGKSADNDDDEEENSLPTVSAPESGDDVADVSDVDASIPKGDEEGTTEKDSSVEQQQEATAKPTKHSSSTKGRKSKREKSYDRARTLAVAAAALAGAKKTRSENNGGNKHLNVKLSPEQKAERNLIRLQALCRQIPIPAPVDPVRVRSWDTWADREEGSVYFRTNKRVLTSHLKRRSLTIDSKSGTKGAGIVLRQMLSARDIGEEETEVVVKCAVEIEAGKSQRHHVSSAFMTTNLLDTFHFLILCLLYCKRKY